jgi:hypothetical protein
MRVDFVPVPFSRVRLNAYFKMAPDAHWVYKKIRSRKLAISHVNCVDMDGLYFLVKQNALVYPVLSYENSEVHNAFDNDITKK